MNSALIFVSISITLVVQFEPLLSKLSCHFYLPFASIQNPFRVLNQSFFQRHVIDLHIVYFQAILFFHVLPPIMITMLQLCDTTTKFHQPPCLLY